MGKDGSATVTVYAPDTNEPVATIHMQHPDGDLVSPSRVAVDEARHRLILSFDEKGLYAFGGSSLVKSARKR